MLDSIVRKLYAHSVMEARVFTRHAVKCPKRGDKNWRRCRCPRWLAITDDSGHRRVSAKTRSWERAEQKARQMMQPGVALPDSRTSIAFAVDKFLRDKQAQNVGEGTAYNYELLLKKQLTKWASEQALVYLDELTLAHLEDFRTWLPVQASTRQYKQALIKAFLGYCLMHGWIASNPALALTRVRVKERPTGYFTQDEFKQICEAATTHYRRQDLPCAELNQRLLTFVLCLRWSGLRIGDAIQLERTRLDKNDRILLYMEKTGEPLGVVIPPKIAAAMRKLPGDKYFFWDGRANYKGVLRSWEYTLASLFKRAEIKKRAHPHMFRDTFAIELLLAGVPLDQVSKLLGHRSIKITERHYAPWVAARQKQLEESVRKAWA